MDRKERQKKVTGIVFGVLFVGVGVLFTLDNMGLVEAGRFRGYWPLFLIGFGLPSVIAPKDSGESVFGVLFTAAGSFLLLRNLDLVDWSVRDAWPLFLVLAGATLLAQSLFARRGREQDGAKTLQNGGAQ